jgi:hypothetical protein
MNIEDPNWRIAYSITILPILRCMIDCFYNVTAILKSPGPKGYQFRESGYYMVPREKVPGSFELPLSSESKRVLAFAADEADRSSSKSISTEHVLLGLLREEECLAAKTLSEGDVELASTREELRRPRTTIRR